MEAAIREGLLALGGGLLEDLLAADPGYRGPRAGCGQGHQAGFAGYRDKAADTVLGKVVIRRAWYHCAACRHGFAPRDGELGVAGSTMSPGLARMTDRAAAAVPFAAAAGLVGELAGVTVTARRAGRRAEADGRAAAAVIEARSAAITARRVVPLPPARPGPDMLYVAIDGTGVPVVPAEAEGRPGKGQDGKARTREVKLCCAFTQTSLDEEGRPVRDPASSSYLATFAPAAEFGTLMAAEARRRGAGTIRQMVILGDGAAWIWNLATAHFPEATQIVDLYHAREHLHDLAKILEFMLGRGKDDWLKARLADLDNGDTDAILTAARVFPLAGRKARDLRKALGYFEHNAHRMRYAHYKKMGMFIGSGAVEAGCKAIVGQRLKLSGMRWTTAGATGILTLRCLQASDRWEEIPARPARITRMPAAPANLKALAQPDPEGLAVLPASHLHSCPAPLGMPMRTRLSERASTVRT